MSAAKHTPGPWTRFNDNACSVQADTKRGSVTVADCGKAARDIDEVRANARLIAAAPELLAALQALMTPDANAHIQRTKEELFRSAPEIEAKARAAIAKAKGKA